jgi:hypothetical protein
MTKTELERLDAIADALGSALDALCDYIAAAKTAKDRPKKPLKAKKKNRAK